jgi:hypothetical protein
VDVGRFLYTAETPAIKFLVHSESMKTGFPLWTNGFPLIPLVAQSLTFFSVVFSSLFLGDAWAACGRRKAVSFEKERGGGSFRRSFA